MHALGQRPAGTITRPFDLVVNPFVGLFQANLQTGVGFPAEQLLDERVVAVAAGFDEATVRRVVRLIDINEYKRRQAAPGLKVTSKAFGVGRRIPIAQRFREI